MKKQFKTVDGYIKTFPEDTQIILKKIRQTIKKSAPKAKESISYQMPSYKLEGKPLVYFGAWKEHIGFYPTPSGTKTFAEELLMYKPSRGAVQFPIDKPIPYELIRNIVLFRVKENQGKKRK